MNTITQNGADVKEITLIQRLQLLVGKNNHSGQELVSKYRPRLFFKILPFFRQATFNKLGFIFRFTYIISNINKYQSQRWIQDCCNIQDGALCGKIRDNSNMTAPKNKSKFKPRLSFPKSFKGLQRTGLESSSLFFKLQPVCLQLTEKKLSQRSFSRESSIRVINSHRNCCENVSWGEKQ